MVGTRCYEHPSKALSGKEKKTPVPVPLHPAGTTLFAPKVGVVGVVVEDVFNQSFAVAAKQGLLRQKSIRRAQTNFGNLYYNPKGI